MIQWTIQRIVDSVAEAEHEAVTATAARKAMLAGVEAMIAGQPEEVKAATRAAVPSLSSPAGDRWRQFAVYLGGVVGATSCVLVDAVRTEMYP